MNTEEQRALIMDFERNRQLLSSLAAQKQQLAIQVEVVKTSLAELDKTSEKTVYKAVGNVLIPKATTDMKKELKDRMDSSELRLKTVEKQEESILKKLNGIKAKIEGTEQTEGKASDADEKKEKKSRK